MCPSIKKKRYEDRLKIMRLTTLVTRRKRGDLIQLYKILNGLDRVEWNNELSKADWGANLRRGWYLLSKRTCNNMFRERPFFSK